MATDFKQILGVELETLGQIKETIKGLKEELQQYTVGSEQYLKVNTELQAEQKKLKAAMHIVKEETDLGKMSFNELNSQLASLKEAWKATADEAKRGELTTAINDVKARINEMNHSIGNFQDQVGQYSQGIIDAFGKMGISAASLTQPLKKIGVDIESLDTTVKLLTGSFKVLAGENLAALERGFTKVSSGVTGFIKSLSGVKAAILATGLGALVVLLGELVANWDSVTDAVGKWIGINQQAILSADQITASLELNNEETQFQLRLMKARGESEMAMIDYALKANRVQIARLNTIVEENNVLIENAKWWWERNRAIEASDRAAEEVLKLEKERKKLLEDKEVLKTLQENQAKLEGIKKETKAAAEATKELVDSQIDIGGVMREQADAEKEVLDGLQKALDLQQAEIDKRKTAMELEVEDYEQKKALLEEYHLSTEELTANHEERMADLRAEVEQAEYEELLRQRDAEKAIDEQRTKEYEKLMKARQTATQNMASGTVGIMKQVSKAMGESTKLGKGFAIAAATIDTIASAVTGFRAGMNQWADAGPMAWMAPVQAALNATMALVAGFAEVQQIKSVDTSGNSGGGSTGGAVALAIPNIEGLSSPVDYTRQVTTETEKEEMNQNNRVYILESDIQQSNNRVKVREEETTF